MSLLFFFIFVAIHFYILQKHQSMMFGKLKETKQRQMVLRHRELEMPCVGGVVGRGEATGRVSVAVGSVILTQGKMRRSALVSKGLG